MLRVVFVGSCIRVLEALLDAATVVGVFNPAPQNRRGKLRDFIVRAGPLRRSLRPRLNEASRGSRKWMRAMAPYDVADLAWRHGVKTVPGRSTRDAAFRKALQHMSPDIGVIANFGEILKGDVLALPRLGFINFHPTLLPKHRGAHPMEHILLNGEAETGMTWHQAVPKFDAGDILAQQRYPVDKDDTPMSLLKRGERLAATMLPGLLADLEAGRCTPRPQDHAEATYCGPLTDAQRQQLDLRMRASGESR